MAEALKKLAQGSPGAAADTNLYTNATTNGFTAAAVWITNTTGAAINVRLYAYAGADANMAAGTALVYDKPLGANDTLIVGPITGANADKIGMRASAVGVTFTVFGVEES